MKKIISLAGFIALVFVIGAAGSYFTMPAVQGWYQQVAKPSWTPPDYVFGPVWTLLYIMIAISGWLVWQKLPGNSKFTSKTMAPYWLQLALNFLWSLVFFGLAQPYFSAVDIVLLLVTIGLNIGTFIKVSKPAAYLLVPYFLWVCYATSLNIGFLALN